MTPELEKEIEDAADADFIVGKTRPIGTRERYLYEEKRESFLNGASFGRKGMYTEEEVSDLIIAALLDHGFDNGKLWFNQNKKND